PWRQGMGPAGDVWPLDGPFAEAWDATTVDGEVGLLTYFMGGDQVDAAPGADLVALRGAFEAAVRPALGPLGESAAGWQRRTGWGRDLFTRGAYSCFRPGQLTRFAGLFWLEEDGKATQVAEVGRLVFAGEHLSDAWPGYMNGGAQTGRLASDAVRQALAGVGRELAPRH
ncbi:MAG: FAD-dependent oxidoreductase, partial [Novosphingobium sp.]